ncbi:MAG: pseudouridine synthase, partial [Bacteroidota bacterium]
DDDAPRKRYDKPEDGGFQRKDGAERGAARKPAPRSSGWDDEAEFTRPESNRGRSYDDRESAPIPRKPRSSRPNLDERHAHFEQKRSKREAFRPERPQRKRNASQGDPLSGEIRLNRFLAMSGIGSRRETDELITAGLVTVNGKLVTELGTKVMPGDDVRYNGERIRNEKLVYILLNKPKDYITTAEDPEARKTVMELIDGACKERVYPVGRLDRNTTGLLLFTNDGDLAKYLTHPSSRVKKIYHVEVDKNVKVADMRRLTEGVELEDGISSVDDVSFEGDGKDKKSVGVELHSGKNRVVRRLFEALGYEVKKLDRVAFAGLTKKDLPRGRWRKLEEKEIGFLKMMGTGKKKKTIEVEAE